MGAAVCIGSGPSLTVADCERVKASGLFTIVTNTTVMRCPWADILYAMDSKWWRRHLGEVLDSGFAGRMVSPTFVCARPADMIEVVPFNHGRGKNSGYGAIRLAQHLGYNRVILLGYDGGPHDGKLHWHGDHPEPLTNGNRAALWPSDFDDIVDMDVINCSRHTDIKAFKRDDLENIL